MQRTKLNGRDVLTPGDERRPATPTRCFLRLYLYGQTPRSLIELGKLRRICNERFTDRYALKVVDFDSNKPLALDTPIFAPSVAMGTLPNQLRHIVQILANQEKVLIGVQLSYSR